MEGRVDVIDNFYYYGAGGGAPGHNGIRARPILWLAALQQTVKPLQLFFSFCLNLKFVPLFSRSVVCAAAFCILIAIVPPVSADIIAASIATVIASTVRFIL